LNGYGEIAAKLWQATMKGGSYQTSCYYSDVSFEQIKALMKNIIPSLRKISSSAVVSMLLTATASAQTPVSLERARRVGEKASTSVYAKYESARSDKFTGGNLRRAKFAPGDPNIRVTVDVPAFRLTLWQSERVVSTYSVGIGLEEFPVPLGERQVTQLIWNPAWIPPASGWVQESKRVKPGEVITAEDPRNPLGKMKIPLGNGYLIHEARSVGDLGNLVSHGCIRMLRKDIYDLAEKIVLARKLPVSAS
jgi:lipoprotein-anchoring transpeptidase ErfK/SrfK